MQAAQPLDKVLKPKLLLDNHLQDMHACSKSMMRSQTMDSIYRLLSLAAATSLVPGKFSVTPSLKLPSRCCSLVPFLPIWSSPDTPVGFDWVELCICGVKAHPEQSSEHCRKAWQKVKLLPFAVSELGSYTDFHWPG